MLISNPLTKFFKNPPKKVISITSLTTISKSGSATLQNRVLDHPNAGPQHYALYLGQCLRSSMSLSTISPTS
jgi:hypothetical protein